MIALSQVRFLRLDQEVIASRLKDMPKGDDKREAKLKEVFLAAGCDKSNLREQVIKYARHPKCNVRNARQFRSRHRRGCAL